MTSKQPDETQLEFDDDEEIDLSKLNFDGDDDDDDDDGIDLNTMMGFYFTESKKNRNIVDMLCEIKRCLETHNKVMIKMYEHLCKSEMKLKDA